MQRILRTGKCERPNCEERHQEMCKFWGRPNKCIRNENCDFLNVTFAYNDDAAGEYKCISCKNSWNDKNCVVEHSINGRETFFCLNCDDWVKLKTRVYDANWALYDKAGKLKVDV